MDLSRIRLGIIAWFLGILIPTLHHAVMHWALVAASEPRNSTYASNGVFEDLPWIDLVYLGVMAITGTILIVTGLRSKAGKKVKEKGEE